MQSIVIIDNGSVYGSEHLYKSMSLAMALSDMTPQPEVQIFLMSDSVIAGISDQQPAKEYDIQPMLKTLISQNAIIKLSKTCMEKRGMKDILLLKGIELGTMEELAEWTLNADKIITF